MTTTWDEASKCPRDGAFTGKVTSTRNLPRSEGGGQLLTLVCPEDNCDYHDMGWVVQKRADGTIPDKQEVVARPRQFQNTMTETEKQRVRDALAQQFADEQKPGYEVRAY